MSVCALPARLHRGRSLFSADLGRGAWFIIEDGQMLLEGGQGVRATVGRGEIIGDFEGIVSSARGFKAAALEECSLFVLNSFVVSRVSL